VGEIVKRAILGLVVGDGMSTSKVTKKRTRERLLKEKYQPNEFGLWEIRGEDPNCDLGGSHHEPLLTRVEGTYSDAVEAALSLDGFWTWGFGGRIKKVEFEKLSDRSKARMVALQEKKAKLEEELAEVNNELAKINHLHRKRKPAW
jgi:hypothetical protein